MIRSLAATSRFGSLPKKGLAGALSEALAVTRQTAANAAVLDAFAFAFIADGRFIDRVIAGSVALFIRPSRVLRSAIDDSRIPTKCG